MIRFVVLASLALPVVALSQDHAAHAPGGATASPYAGMERHAIKSLSPDDLAELRRGGGWGLALPAELNGVPGPAHVLELRAELALSDEQTVAVQTLFDAMQAEARAAGERFIAAEAALEAAFRAGDLAPERLRRLLAAAADARAVLRHAHLARHVETLAILSDDQVARYSALRGYGAPCTDAAHDPASGPGHARCGE